MNKRDREPLYPDPGLLKKISEGAGAFRFANARQKVLLEKMAKGMAEMRARGIDPWEELRKIKVKRALDRGDRVPLPPEVLKDINARTRDTLLKWKRFSRMIESCSAYGIDLKELASPRFLSDFLENYCLCLLLQYPELRGRGEELSPNFFEGAENREIFLMWKGISSAELLRLSLNPYLYRHFDYLVNRVLPPESGRATEIAFNDCIYHLGKETLKRLEARGVDPPVKPRKAKGRIKKRTGTRRSKT